MANVRRDPIGDHAEEARDAQIGDDDHHAEQKRDGVEVDGAVRLLGAQDAGADHQARAEQRRTRAIDTIDRHLADRDEGVGGGENGHRGNQGEIGHRDGFPQPPARVTPL